MKYIFTLFALLCASPFLFGQFRYINPVPGSSYHHPEVGIILKNGQLIDRISVGDKNLLEITGSISGSHQWEAVLADDDKTVTITPVPIFAYGETVTVTVKARLRTREGATIEGTSFTFNTRTKPTPEQEEKYRQAELETFIEEYGYDPTKKTAEKAMYPLDSMPTFTISINNNPAPGSFFYTNHEEAGDGDQLTNSFTTILRNDGTIRWARDLGEDGRDFKVNANGYLTYFDKDEPSYILLDSNYNIIDSVGCVNGYKTNSHDFMMYPDGHAFLIAQDEQTMDMTAYGGLPDATVQALIIQELDTFKNLVFEWRSWDHFLFTDANSYVPLTNATVDYCHGNSVERDFDGNLLISSRNMSELTKIDLSTGDIIWRMGGENNQFTFVNDNIPEHFHSQHDLRRLDNGNLMLFNNGNQLPIQISSAKEYAVDEVNKIATLVWYYEHPDVSGAHVYGSATGNAQRLSNGNTLISWGLTTGADMPDHTEVDYDKNIVWEMNFDSASQKTYRIHKYIWRPCGRITGYTMRAKPKVFKATLKWGSATDAESYIVEYQVAGNPTINTVTTSDTSVVITGLTPSTKYLWRVQTVCSSTNPNSPSPFSQTKKFTTGAAKMGDDQMTDESISVYPVPASDELIIEFEEAETATISVLNTVGMVMLQETINNENKLNIDIRDWPAGVYLLEINKDDHTTIQKIIKD